MAERRPVVGGASLPGDEDAMGWALAQARLAQDLGEVPVGAVVLAADGTLLAAAHNRTIVDGDPTAHAEVVALRQAAQRAGNHRLTGARLYVTLEPCAMCLGAMLHARLAEIVFGAPDPKTGACGGVVDLAAEPRLNHQTRVRAGVLAAQCGQLLRDFFRVRRGAAPRATPLSSQEPSSMSPSGIYLISPSGAVHDTDALGVAVRRLRALGFRVAVDRAAKACHERFAGTDRQRLAGLARALRQAHPLVMITRGGYGLSRLLPLIDWPAVADSGKLFIGHSDFTAFQLALLAQTGAASLAGPAAVFDFGGKTVDDLMQDLFLETLAGELEILSFESPGSDAVDARGVLWGGNLAMVASLAGTPYLPRVAGGILFLEDVGEYPYRIERMLTQLWHAGVLAEQRAIVLGQFTDYRAGPHENGYGLDSVVRWLRRTVRVPVVTGLPFGHVRTKATLPVGRPVGIATQAGMAYLVLQEHLH